MTNGADGVGLLRSEFIFMGRESAPTEDEQTHMQAIFGTRSENLKTDMEEYLKTAGDEAEVSEATTSDVFYETQQIQPKLRDAEAPQKARDYIAGLGGPGNIVKVESAAETRLRVVVRDSAAVDEAALTSAGSLAWSPWMAAPCT